ncbi:zinc finger transcriptional activator [Rhodotorula toruloides]
MDTPDQTDKAGKQNARPKRTYRACQPCRARKLKCDLGDPDNPSDPPCRRCRRESRDCVFVARANAKTYLEPLPTGSPAPYTTVVPTRPKARNAGSSPDESTSSTPGAPPARALAHPYATPHVGGWSAPPNRAGHGVASTSTSGAATPSLPSAMSFPPFHHGLPSQSTPALGYDPMNPHLRHLAAARTASGTSTPERVAQPLHAASAVATVSDEEGVVTDGDEDEDENMEDLSHSRHDSREPGGPSDANVLLSSTLHNPSDALKLLATASSLRSMSAETAFTAPDSRSAGPSGSNTRNASRSRERRASRSRERAAVVAGAGPGSMTPGSGKGKELERGRPGAPSPLSQTEAGWDRWVPVREGMVTVAEAEALLSFFEHHMSPLYPLLSPRIFTPAHLRSLTSRESLLLAAMITISARYSSLPSGPRARLIHEALAEYCRDELVGILDGSGELRHISSVEALLLLTEWPPITVGRSQKTRERPRGRKSRSWAHSGSIATVEEVEEQEEDEGVEDAEALLRSSAQYDGMSWSFIGCAVRLAQELGIHNIYFGSEKERGPITWEEERCLRTWIYCYNADRHVSVRLGRNAVIQAYMSSSWWEQVTSHASQGVRREGLSELWAERSLPQGLIAALMGTIQERLYPNKEITRSMLRTGQWESFVRSLDHELQMMLLKSRTVLQQGNIESTLLQMEFEYVRLYGNAIALRALQERLRRAVKANDLLFVSPSLLNLQEGQWVLDALAAAQSILDRTVKFLVPKGYLRLAPSRLHQRILFAATFLFKALAVGVVEHGQPKVIHLLDQTIAVLHNNAVDRQHIGRGFAALLRRLQEQCKPTLLSRFGVRPNGQANGENGEGHAQTPAAMNQPSPNPQAATLQPPTSADPALAPTPNAGPSLPPSAAATPGAGVATLPALGLSISPTHASAGQGLLTPGYSTQHPSTIPAPASFPPPPLPASSAASHPSWLAPTPAGEQTVEFGGFKLGTAPLGADYSNPFEWDPMNHSIQVGHEQDLLFQSLWGTGAAGLGASGDFGSGINPALNLFGTLVGDE